MWWMQEQKPHLIFFPPSPQVKVLELESMLDNERLRLGELRKKHYEIAGVALDQLAEGNGETPSLVNPVTMSPKPLKPSLMKKPPLAQKPNIPPKNQFAYSVSFNFFFSFFFSFLQIIAHSRNVSDQYII